MKKQHICNHVTLVRNIALLLATAAVMTAAPAARANSWELSYSGLDQYCTSTGGTSGAWTWTPLGMMDAAHDASSTDLDLTVNDDTYVYLELKLSTSSGSGSKTVGAECFATAYATWTDSEGGPATTIVSTANLTNTLNSETTYYCDTSATVSGGSYADAFDSVLAPGGTTLNGGGMDNPIYPDIADFTTTNGASLGDESNDGSFDVNSGVLTGSTTASATCFISYTNDYVLEGGETSFSATNTVQGVVLESFQYDGDDVMIPSEEYNSSIDMGGIANIALYNDDDDDIRVEKPTAGTP